VSVGVSPVKFSVAESTFMNFYETTGIVEVVSNFNITRMPETIIRFGM
jgi:hypothetical protein